MQGLPAGLAIETVGARAGLGAERRAAMTGGAQHLAGLGEQGPADAAALMAGIDEQRPDRAVARVCGGEAQDEAVLLPDPDAGVVGEPSVVGIGNARGIHQLVLAHGKANLGDARALLESDATDVAVHAAASSG